MLKDKSEILQVIDNPLRIILLYNNNNKLNISNNDINSFLIYNNIEIL